MKFTLRTLIVLAGLLANVPLLYGILTYDLNAMHLTYGLMMVATVFVILTVVFESLLAHRFIGYAVIAVALLFFQTVLVKEIQFAGFTNLSAILIITVGWLAVGIFALVAHRVVVYFTRLWHTRRRRFWILMGIVAGIPMNLILVTFYNTLLWPYMWPRTILIAMFAIIVVLLAAPEEGYGSRMIKVAGGIMMFVGECYLIHIYSEFIKVPGPLAALHMVSMTGMYCVLGLNFVNQMNPKRNTGYAPLVHGKELPFVAAIVPTYGEPLDVLEYTLTSILRLNYPKNRFAVIVSDDGHREELRDLASRLGVHYNFGAQKDAKAGNLNSSLDFIDEHFPEATLILTQDADEILHPEFLRKIVGYFQQDPKIGFVQTPKEAYAPVDDPFGVRDRIFYDVTQVGRNGYGAAFACGSGVVWRIEAVRAVGGFDTWNVVEDLTTSYKIHSAGYRSEYHAEVLSIGLAPDDIPGLLKQRGTWAVDNWRLFLFDNPLFKEAALSVWQRLQYFELGMFHATTAFITPIIMLVPILSIFTASPLFLEGSALFPWIAATAIYYLVTSQGNASHVVRMWQFWVGHGPTFIKAFRIAIRSRSEKPKYVVTRKTRQDGFYGQMLWMQFAYIGLAILALIRVVIVPPPVPTSTIVANVVMMIYFSYLLSAICRASLYGVKFTPLKIAQRFLPQRPRTISSVPNT